MRAMLIEEFGDEGVFRAAKLPDPKPGPGEVLVRVRAASVNPIDAKIRAGLVPALAPELPAVLGCDVAGTVEAVGDGVEDFESGQEVFGCAGGMRGCDGSYAELMRADARLLVAKPDVIDFRHAAALPLVGITAWMALERFPAGIEGPVLVHGATGGVGHIAVEILHHWGHEVHATCGSAAKERVAEQLGATVLIRHDQETVGDYVDRLTGGTGYQAVFDTVGGRVLGRSLEAAAVNGTVVTINARGEHELGLLHAKGLALHGIFMGRPLVTGENRESLGEIMAELVHLVTIGDVRPLVDERRFAMTEMADAHRHLASGDAVGKVVAEW